MMLCMSKKILAKFFEKMQQLLKSEVLYIREKILLKFFKIMELFSEFRYLISDGKKLEVLQEII